MSLGMLKDNPLMARAKALLSKVSLTYKLT